MISSLRNYNTAQQLTFFFFFWRSDRIGQISSKFPSIFMSVTLTSVDKLTEVGGIPLCALLCLLETMLPLIVNLKYYLDKFPQLG